MGIRTTKKGPQIALPEGPLLVDLMTDWARHEPPPFLEA